MTCQALELLRLVDGRFACIAVDKRLYKTAGCKIVVEIGLSSILSVQLAQSADDAFGGVVLQQVF